MFIVPEVLLFLYALFEYGLTLKIRKEFDYRYVFAALRSEIVKNRIESMHVGTMIPHFKKGDFKILTIPVPENIKDQEKIGKVYLNILKKIDNNKRIISSLEQLGQTIFKHWFIDFQYPNEYGEPYLSSGGEMIENEVCMIPKGWAVGTAGDLFEFAPKTSLKKGDEAIFVEMKNLESSAMINEWTYKSFTGSGSKFINGDTLLARITPCLENGKIGFVDFLPRNTVGWGSTEFIPIR